MEGENGSCFVSEKELPAEIEDKEKHDFPTDQTAETETANPTVENAGKVTANPAVENAGKVTAKPSNAAAKSLRTSKPVSKLSTPAKASAALRGSTVRSALVPPGSRSSPSTASRTRTVSNNGNSPADKGVQTSLTSVSSSKAAVSANSVTKRNSTGTPAGIAERRANVGTPATLRQRPSTTASAPAKPSPSVAETRGASTKSVTSSSHAEPKKSPAPLTLKSSSSCLKAPSPAGSSKPLSLSTRSSPKPTENAVRRTAIAKPSVLSSGERCNVSVR